MIKNALQSPFTVNLGGVDYVLDKIVNAFLVAYYYGSLTQMLMTRKRIYDYLMGVTLEIRNHNTFIFTVRLLLMANDEKNLKSFLMSYGENTNNINATDIEKLLFGVNLQKIENRKVFARILLMKYFGYYYEDEQFSIELIELTEELFSSLGKDGGVSNLFKPFINSLDENSKRIDEKTILSIVYRIFDVGASGLYDDCFQLLAHLSYEEIDSNVQQKHLQFLINCMKDKNVRGCKDVGLAVQNFRKSVNADFTVLDDAVNETWPAFYRDTYLLNIETHDSESAWLYINGFVESINKDNENQGKNGAYSGRCVNAYITIANIVAIDGVKLTSAQLKVVILCVKGTLWAETQTIDAKIDSLELLCLLQLLMPKNKQVKALLSDIEEKWEEIKKSKSLFLLKGYSYSNLCINYIFLKMILRQAKESDVIRCFVNIQNDEVASQIIALRFMDRVIELCELNKWNEIEKNSILSSVLALSYSNNEDVRFYSMSIMTKLLNTSLKTCCLERLVEMMDTEPYKAKVGMLYRLKNQEMEDSKIDYIFSKGATDNHYWVRKAAKERNVNLNGKSS